MQIRRGVNRVGVGRFAANEPLVSRQQDVASQAGVKQSLELIISSGEKERTTRPVPLNGTHRPPSKDAAHHTGPKPATCRSKGRIVDPGQLQVMGYIIGGN